MGKPEILRAIRQHCDECMGDNRPVDCSVESCTLWKYRCGKDPDHIPKQFTEEQREMYRSMAKKNLVRDSDNVNNN